jgi:20S proteasome subunit beta 4
LHALEISANPSCPSVLYARPPPAQIRPLDSHKMVAAAGPQADCVQFVEYIQKNVALYEFRSNLKLSTRAAVSYIRSELAYALRSSPYQVNMLIGGWDKAEGPSLHFMDYLASSTPASYSAQGYAGYFILSTMDRHWKAGMSLEEGKELARRCIKELQTRFLLSQPAFVVKVADANGVRLESL